MPTTSPDALRTMNSPLALCTDAEIDSAVHAFITEVTGVLAVLQRQH